MDEIIVLLRWLLRPRRALLVLALLPALLLLAALGFQYGGGLQPCPLCLWQRWAHLAGLLLALLGLLTTTRGNNAVWPWLALSSLAIAAGAGVAFFHVGVEQHWWQYTCSSVAISNGSDLNDLKTALLATPAVRCDEVAWRFLTLSMAGWNFIISLVLVGYGLWAAWLAAVRPRSPHLFKVN
jgi:disulfide bond formation protein DsbB